MKSINLKFERVVPSDDQVMILYQLLKLRRNSISHVSIPRFDDHREFVNNNPYLIWYLIFKGKNILGSVYIQKDNSIGLNLINEYGDNDVLNIIEFIKRSHSPLPSIKSYRRGEFFLNLSPLNTKLLKTLEKLKKREIQKSFQI